MSTTSEKRTKEEKDEKEERREEKKERTILTEQFCPICGISSKEKKFIKFLCIDCWIAQQKFKIPEKIIIQQCRKCGRIKLREWTDDKSSIENEITRMCASHRDVKAKVIELTDQYVRIELEIEGTKFEREIPIEIKRTLCPECTKEVRGYYEAIIQLRLKSHERRGRKGRKEFEEIVSQLRGLKDRIQKELEKVTFVPKVDEQPFGFDIYVGSTSEAYNVLRLLGLKYTSTKKLFTQKAGKKLYRTTFLIRI